MKLKGIKTKIFKQVNKLIKKDYESVEGGFKIMEDGTVKVDGLTLKDEDTIQIKIKVLKKIIADAKIKEGI